MEVSGFVPTRFMLIMSHLVITILLFWTSSDNIKSCLPETYTTEEFNSLTTENLVDLRIKMRINESAYYFLGFTYLGLIGSECLTIGLSVTIVLLAIELLGFLSGITMFMHGQGIISIFAHGSASIALSFFIFESWPCDWFWYVFGFCSVLPGLTELTSLITFLLGWHV